MAQNGNPKPYDWKAIFLDSLCTVPVVTRAAKAAGVHTTHVYAMRRADPAFAAAWEVAMESGVDRAEAELYRRAVDGWLEPMTSGGAPIYEVERDPATGQPVQVVEEYVTFDAQGAAVLRKRMVSRLLLDERGQPIPLMVRKHSDALLQTIIKGRRRALYAERVEQTGANGGAVQRQIVVATGVPRVDDFSDVA